MANRLRGVFWGQGSLGRGLWLVVAAAAGMVVVAAMLGGPPADAQGSAPCPSPAGVFFNAPAITSVPATVTGCNTGAESDNNPETPPSCTSSADNAVWWRLSFFPGPPGPLVIDTLGSDFDTVLSVWSEDFDTGDLSIEACNDDIDFGGGILQSRVLFTPDGNEDYYIAVQGFSSNTGQVQLNIAPDCAAAGATNDFFECADVIGPAIPITVDADLVGFSSQPGEPQPSCGGNDEYASGWWSWTPTADASVVLSSAGSRDRSHSISAYTGSSIDDLTEVACGRFVPGPSSDVPPETLFDVTADTTYWIRADESLFDSGQFTLRIQPVCDVTPTNDYFQCATTLTPGTSATVDLNQAGRQADEPTNCLSYGKTVWYRFSSTTAAKRLVSAGSDSGDIYVGVYTGTAIDALTEIGCENRDRTGNSFNGAELIFDAAAETTYWVQVTSEYGANATVQIDDLCDVAPTNDYFDCARVLSGTLPITNQVDMANATREQGESSPTCASLDYSLWWTWTPAVDQPVLIGSEGLVRSIDVVTGTSVADLSPVECGDEDTSPEYAVTLDAKAGTTYHVRVNGFNSSNPVEVSIRDLCSIEPTNEYAICAEPLASALPSSATKPAEGLRYDRDEPFPSCGSKNNSMWFVWTPNESARVTVEDDNGDDTLSIWTGDPDAPSELTCAQGSFEEPAVVEFDAMAGTPYLIRVDTFSSSPVTVTVDSLCASTAQPNDLFGCATPIVESLPVTIQASNVGATADTPVPVCRSNFGQDVWWRWTATRSEQVTIDLAGSGFDTVLAVWTGDAADLTSVACNDDFTGLVSFAAFDASAGTEYFIQVAGFAIAEGSIQMRIEGENEPPIAVDDEFDVPRGATTTVAVLDNDIDDGPVQIVAVTAPTPAGVVTTQISSDGQGVDVTAGPTFLGSVEFDYTIEDEFGERATASVIVNPAGPVLRCNSLAVTIIWGPGAVATGGDDVILGTSGADQIDALGGDDTICGLGGNDTIQGGRDNDTIFGDGGNDKLFGAQGADEIHGGDGGDTIHGNRGDDELFGDDGDDRIFGYAHDDTIDGGDGDDRLHGNFGDDVIQGGPGADRIFGYGDNDTIDAGDGDDLVGGNFGNDMIEGGSGNDTLYGSDGNDTVSGGPGNDSVEGNSLNDTVNGGSGNDELDGGIGFDVCNGNGGTDTASRCETITGVP